MQVHGSDRAERVRTDIFWGYSKYEKTHSFALQSDDVDDVLGADREETLRRRVVADCGSQVTSMLLQAEEDVGVSSNLESCWSL